MRPRHPVDPENYSSERKRHQWEISIRDYLEQLINERDRLYDIRFRAAETAVTAALSAQEKATASAFSASEKAVLKAEDAQKDYNQRSNEFRGQLDDQAKTLMPRAEVQQIMKSVEEKLDGLKATHEKDVDILRTEIAGLRESRSLVVGKDTALDSVHVQKNWSMGIVVAVVLAVGGWGVALLSLIMEWGNKK